MRITVDFLTLYFLTLSSLITLHIHLSFDFMLVFRCSLCSPPYNNAHLYCHMKMSLWSKWHSMMTKGSFFVLFFFFLPNLTPFACLIDPYTASPGHLSFFPTPWYQSTLWNQLVCNYEKIILQSLGLLNMHFIYFRYLTLNSFPVS